MLSLRVIDAEVEKELLAEWVVEGTVAEPDPETEKGVVNDEDAVNEAFGVAGVQRAPPPPGRHRQTVLPFTLSLHGLLGTVSGE